MEVSVRELKNRLSTYLRRVAAGEVVVITSHKRPVARLVPAPPPPMGKEDLKALTARLKALPWVRMGAGGKVRGLRKGIPLRGKGPTAAEIVLEDRQ